MNLEALVARIGDDGALALAGLLVGAVFGAAAQRSRFCLRSAAIELSTLKLGEKIAIWTIAFSTAVAAAQAFIALGMLDVSEARQLASRGSMSGAVIGGLMFGVGMIMARGCASRLLVLSATGNLRALISGLVLTVVAQASLRGVLSPLREWLGGLWLVDGGPSRNLLALVGGGAKLGLVLGIVWLAVGVWFVRANKVDAPRVIGAALVGLAVAGGWLVTYALSQISFAPIALKSVSFTGPSADTLMGLINSPTVPLGFDIGLVPGVFIGSLISAFLGGELKLEGYQGGASMTRYLSGATLMGFGGMLAGGCAVGAGMTGGAIFAVTAWVALLFMWIGAMAATRYLGES